jgi:hypothetical protein
MWMNGRTNRGTERHDEAHSRFSQFCELSQNLIQNSTVENNYISVTVLCYE